MPHYIYKEIGETPLDLIKKLKTDSNRKYSFAGRLDPMARGQMIILEGEECKQTHLYCNLTKIYEFEVLFGFQTDTYDILGLVENFTLTKNNISIPLNNYIGTILQSYPPYSSITIKGQPLWWWSREGKLSEIEIPSKEVSIKELEYLEEVSITNSLELLETIKNKIFKLEEGKREGFRVDKIVSKWEEILLQNNFQPTIRKFRATVSSGTYIRSLVNRMGEDLGIGAIALDIHRTRFIEK